MLRVGEEGGVGGVEFLVGGFEGFGHLFEAPWGLSMKAHNGSFSPVRWVKYEGPSQRGCAGRPFWFYYFKRGPSLSGWLSAKTLIAGGI